MLVGSRLGRYRDGETTLARQVVGTLAAEMLCLADRLFFAYPLWQQARATGADLLWRVKKHLRLPCRQRLAVDSGPGAGARRRAGRALSRALGRLRRPSTN